MKRTNVILCAAKGVCRTSSPDGGLSLRHVRHWGDEALTKRRFSVTASFTLGIRIESSQSRSEVLARSVAGAVGRGGRLDEVGEQLDSLQPASRRGHTLPAKDASATLTDPSVCQFGRAP